MIFHISKCFIFGIFQLGFFKRMVLSSQQFQNKAHDQNFFFLHFLFKIRRHLSPDFDSTCCVNKQLSPKNSAAYNVLSPEGV